MVWKKAMIQVMPRVIGTNSQWYMAVRANCALAQFTMLMSMLSIMLFLLVFYCLVFCAARISSPLTCSARSWSLAKLVFR